MANVKITDLTALSGALVDADLFEMVDDVAGTPASRKVTAAVVLDYVNSNYNAALFLESAISGLGLVWVSVSAIDISIGAAYIESLGLVYDVPAAISLTGLSSLTASTLYHVYLYDNAGTPAAEVVTTAPASPFAGTARSKTSDTTRRYLGSVYVNASQQIVPFQHHIQSGLMVYRNAGGSAPSFRVLSAGSATTETAVSCGSFVPSTSRDVLLKISNTDATANVLIGSPDEAMSTSIYFASIAGSVRSFMPCPTNASQQVAYLNSTAASGAFIDLLGYWYAR
jgi:hypothetical protein